MTASEELFERFAKQTRLRVLRVATAGRLGERRPDYVIRARARRARRLVVEIKEFVPNREEAIAIAEGAQSGRWSMPSVTPGKRIRYAIDSAGPQLRSLAGGKYPTLLILYDALLGRSLHSDPYSVLTAMRGLDVVPVEVPRDPRISPTFGAARPGPKKRMTKEHNTSISALALLQEAGPKALALMVYHNSFAAVPLRVSDLPRRGVYHFVMKRDQSGWIARDPTV
jgi:hypothetical protein